MKDRIAKWYKQGLWSADMVANAVGRTFNGVLFTAADYQEITGEIIPEGRQVCPHCENK